MIPRIISLLTLASALGSAAPEERTQWFHEARFGMFIHWGLYAVPAGEWDGKPIDGIGEWIMKNGNIPVAEYKKFTDRFTAANYDPSAWAKLAKQAGMKYVVITSKHHDGFALYDSAVTDWDVINSAAGRDLLDPLAKAVRAEGLKFGLYYSQAQDWTHPGGLKFLGTSKGWDPAQEGDYDTYLQTIALPQAKEIIEKYEPSILWWDTPMDMTEERVKPFAEWMSKHPLIINNDRLGKGFKGDTMTPEQNIPPRGYPDKMFEVCMTMNDTWGYKKNDHQWKSVQTLIRMLSDISSKGGNFLLNIGPMADGTIPPESIERLQAVGRWMDINGEAIYASQASPFPRRLEWGRVTQKITADGTTLYVHIWNWPSDGQILLPTLKELPSSGKLLAGGAEVTAKHTNEGVIIQLPGAATDADVSVVRLDFEGSVTVTQAPFISPEADGIFQLLANDADPHGLVHGNMVLKGMGKDAYLTEWKGARYWVEYQLKTAKAGKWLVEAEVAAPDATKLTLGVAKSSAVAVEIPATGSGITWKTIKLGELEVPAGEFSLELRPVIAEWKPIHLRKVRLSPVAE